MGFLSRLTLSLSRVHPLVYLLMYLIAVPTFGFLYAFIATQGFYAPYARFEPDARSDRLQLTFDLQAALHRSFAERAGREFIVGNWQLDPKVLGVHDLNLTDGTQLSFRVYVLLRGIGELNRKQVVNWRIVVTVPAFPSKLTSCGPGPVDKRLKFYAYIRFCGPNVVTSRYPTVDFSADADFFKVAPLSKEENEALFELIFDRGSDDHGHFGLALNLQEEVQLQRYLRGVRGDPSAISGHLWRMVYLSAVVITTLGLGDIIPITPQARTLVAAEGITGIALAGLFLNALAYRASSSRQ
jgi:hypothetical protein